MGSLQKFAEFSLRARSSMKRFVDCVASAHCTELGLYVPLRAFPYLSQVPRDVSLRFFDDDPGLLGRYFDGFDVAIENRAALEERPPDHLMICSLAFGDRIVQRLPESAKRVMQMTLWADLFRGQFA